jgi:predicted O-methyltransferase YrrM
LIFLPLVHKKYEVMINPLIEKIYETGFVEDAGGDAVPVLPYGISCESGRVLYDLIRTGKPENTLETGLAYGMSALFICQAHCDNGTGRHTAIDPCEESTYRSIGLLNLERAGLRNRLRFFPRSSAEILPQLLHEKERLGFAFIDGRHLFDWVLLDFFYIDQMLEKGGIVVIDDLWMPGVRKAVSFILKNSHYRLVRPPVKRHVPVWKRMLRSCRRIAQNPLGRDWKLKFIPENIAILRKAAGDERAWNFHRAF